MDNLLQKILSYLGSIIVIAGSISAIVYYLLKFFSKKWLENQFAKRLEEFKRKQSELLENYRFEINSRFNRISKIHEKEFEVLPNAWYKLQDAYMEFLNISSPLQSWPDLNRYSEIQLESFVAKSGLLDFQKDEILAVEDKLGYYQEKYYWISLNKANDKLNDFRIYLRYNKIFLSKDLFKLFSNIETIMIETVATFETMHEKEHWEKHYEMFKKLRDNGGKIIEELEMLVQSRLHFDNS